MKRFIFLTLFFLITPINLSISLFALSRVSQTKQLSVLTQNSLKELAAMHSPSQLYAALPRAAGEVLGAVTTGDARPIIIRKYLEKYKSPLAPYAEYIVQTSEKYGLDWRLLVAIAQQESNLGKKIPENSYNAWGWGVHSRGTLRFSSWEEAIDTVARGIKEEYLDKGYTTPEEIMKKYTPLSNGSWAFGVNQFIEELETGEVE